MLNQVGANAPIYWPDDGTKATYGIVDVEVLNEFHNPESEWTERSILISPNSGVTSTKDAFTVKHFQAHFWLDNATEPVDPNKIFDLLHSITEMVHSKQQTEEVKVVLHCLDACQKSGLFLVCCNMMLMMRKVKGDERIHLAHCILSARESLPQIIVDEEQLKLCFDIAELQWDRYFEYLYKTALLN